MASLTLRISLEGGRVTKTIQFDPNTTVFDACRIIRDKFAEAVHGQAQEYGLFLADEDNRQGVWLEQARNLGYYMLRNQDILEYRRKLRTLRVRMLDGAVKTILVDDSQPVTQLMVVICTKIGITNHEEYGLVREETDPQNENLPDNTKTGFSTLTLKRKTIEKDRDAKMESLRKKLKTDDEINWIDPGKTLREQGIDESETVLLRRKFFFSDQNIDSRDPVQLNLLYVQARDAILDGTHPVTENKACEFAGLQAQIQFGDYNEQKHKPGFLDLKEFLPQSYVRIKNIEKKVFAEHKGHYNLSEIDAKVEYTKTARVLPTYGVTFFLVKEKMPGKNKLVPRLLGVTKDSVLRLDERTKEILKTWPLTTVRRWGASPNTFTLDFGDYADQYYSVQTTEAEQIVQLIAGYIDIILKKKQSKDHFGIEGDEGSTMVEESVAPSKATFLQHETNRVEKLNTESLAKPVIMRGSDGERTFTHNDVQTVQYGAIVGQVNVTHQPPTLKPTRISTVLSEPQRALLGYISAGQDALTKASEELMTKADILDLGNDPHSIQWRENTVETSKQTVSTHIATMNAATAQVVTASQPDDVDSEAIGAAVSQIAQTIPEVTKEVRLIAALLEDDTGGDKLLEAARKLCNAFSDLLKAAEPESQQPRQNLLNAASRVGEASGQVLYTIGEESVESRELHDMLLGLAKAVANTTAALVLRAKSIAASCDDDETRNRVIGAASQCALATSQLVACARVVAPTLQNDACREQLEAAAREVAKAVTTLVGICNEATDNQQLKGDLLTAAKEVSRTLTDLLEHIKLSSRERARQVSEERSHVESVLIVSDRLVSTSDPQEMVKQAKTLGHATAQLIESIKIEAETQSDSEMQRKLLSAAKQLADATAKLVEAARLCSSSPHDAHNQEALRNAAEELREITASAANTPATKRKLIQRLEVCSKQAASAARDCIASSRNAIQYSEDKQSKEVLLQDCQTVNDLIPRLVNGMKNVSDRPDDSSTQLGLIESAEQFLEPGAQLGQSARSLQPTVHDSVASQQLSKSAYNLSQTIHELRISSIRAREACGGQELESALEAISNMRNILNDTRRAAAEGALRPLPGETAETAAQQLGQTTKGVGISMTQLMSAVSQGNRLYAGSAGRDTAISLGDFTKSVRGVAATTGNPTIIDCADDVVICSMRLIEEAQRMLQNLGDQPNLTRAARDLTGSLAKTIDCLPGQRDVDDALRSITELSEVLTLNEYPPSDKTYGQLQAELKEAAEQLNTAGGHIVQAHASPARLASTSKEFNEAYKDLLTVSLEMAGQTPDEIARNNVVTSIRGVSSTSVQLLSTAKSVAADPQQPNAKNQLAQAARAVTESINYLVDVCTSAAPGQKECDNAIRTIEALRPLLESANEPLNDQGYSECFHTIVENSKKLGDGMSGMANHAKLSQRVEFCYTVNSVSEPIRGLIESSAQAAYLIGVSDPTSVAGRPGLVDQSQLARGMHAIRQSCDVLVAPSSTHQQIVSAATVIAKHTSALCNSCRLAGQYTSNPVAKREFVQAAKDLAHATSVVVEQIKALDKDFNTESRTRCAKSTGPLLESLNSLYQFASSPEFISVPGRISSEGRQAQEPILQSGRRVLDGSIDLVKSAKSLVISPQNPAVWQQIAVHSRFISENIKNVVAYMKDNAPGQAQCDTALDQLSACARDLDSAAMSIGMQELHPRRENNLQGYTNQALGAAAELVDKLDTVRTASKNNTEILSHAVLQIPRYAMPLTSAAIGASSHVVHSNQQIEILDETKTVVESATNLIHATKKSAGISKTPLSNQELEEYVQTTRDAIHELVSTLEKISTENGVVTGLMEQISRSIARISDKRQSFLGMSEGSYVDYQTRMVQNAKEVARLANDINAKAATDSGRLPQLSVDMTQHYIQLGQDAMGASSLTTTPDVAIRIRHTVQDLGNSVSTLIQSSVGARQTDAGHYPDIQRNTRDVTEKVSHVLAALHAGSRGTQACINAASTVSGIIGDLDTTIMFATAGTLHSDDCDGQFSDHRELILKTAKSLVEDTKVLVAGAAGTQDQLAAAAQNAVTTILQLAEAVKRGACSLGSSQPDSQVMVINAVKDVAAALGELINATKLASGKPIHDPAMNDLKESAKIMVMNVTSLLKTVKAVEDEHTRGTRAMEATVEAISQEVRAMNAPDTARGPPATPEDLVRATKNVTFATAKAVAAGASNLQADIAAAANNGRRTISEMLIICKSVAWHCAESAELRQRTLDAGAAVGNSYRDLLEGVLRNCTADERMHLSRRVAKCVTDLVAMAQLLKGSDWVDPEDPTVIAENELLGAAASIDAAAKKLANLRPRQSAKDVKDVDENMKFDEIIIEAAKGIMAASSALVRAANAAQRELIDQGKVDRRPLTSSDDGQWSEGLISAARLVAAAAHSLVEAAQNLVQGVSTEELLISTAKQVASSTAQLLIACRVKSDPNSESGRRLQAAGNAVIKSTDNLVRAAQQAIDMEEEHTLRINTNMVDGMAQEINARSEVLKRERELEAARNKLTAIRQAKYRHRPGGNDESDGEQYGFQTPTHNMSDNMAYNASTQSPSFINSSTSTTYQTTEYTPRKSLTAVATPRPYHSNDSSPMHHHHNTGSLRSSGKLSENPNLNRSFESSSTSNIQHSTLDPVNKANIKNNLEACIQDLHEKTFGKTGVVAPMSTFKYSTSSNSSSKVGTPNNNTANGQSYEGFTTRYETRNFDDKSPSKTSTSKTAGQDITKIDNQFSQMNLVSEDGRLNLIDNSGSPRLTSMTQRVLERKTLTTTTESRMETKTEKHKFRLE